MSDKKDYVKVLKALDRTGPLSTTLNHLSEVQIETEDSKLSEALKNLNAALRQQLPIDKKGRLLGLDPQLYPHLSRGIAQIEKYCIAVRDAAEKKWEISCEARRLDTAACVGKHPARKRPSAAGCEHGKG